ncbi:MAG: chaplin family protein [Actinoallomurus sp.]
MPTWAKSTARATLLTASFIALGAGPALADVTDGAGSVLGGNQVKAPVSAPVDISGNAVAVIGHSVAGSVGGASVHRGGSGGRQSTSGRHSIGGGNQVDAPISAPVNACGNAIAVIGRSAAGCEGGASVSGRHGGGHRGHTTGAGSVLGGNQINVPISAPINICGNSAAVLGRAAAGCKGGAAVRNGGHGHDGGGSTSGRHSIGGGNQINVPIKAPVNVCGNAIGNALAGCEGGAAVTGPGSTGGGRTNGRHSVLGGNQVTAPITAPINVCGNAAAILGDAAAGCAGVIPPVHGGSAPGGRTNGRHSVGGGNQVTAPITAPVNVCGNAAALIGHAVAGCVGGDDHCVSPHHAMAAGAPLSELPQLPGTPRTGAVAAGPAAMPVLPRLRFQPYRRMSAPVTPAVPDAPRPVAVPMPQTPPAGSLPAGGRLTDLADKIPGALPALPKGAVDAAQPASDAAQAASDLAQPADGTSQTASGTGSGVADGVPGARALPNLPGVPVTRPVPEAGAALPDPARNGLPSVGGPPMRIPPMRTVAAQEPAQAETGALAALALAALLAASSGAISMVRRLRDR